MDAPLARLLKDVSRSFYLTLRVLPRKVRPQIGLAYLLARTTDTIADTAIVPVAQRLSALGEFRARVSGKSEKPLVFKDLVCHQGKPAERILLERQEEMLRLLGKLADRDRVLVRQVLRTISSGQELDILRFQAASDNHIIALKDEGELEDYTYRVAGCVGEFWTRICRAHLFPKAPLDELRLLENGIRFGKGLQLVNILRDLPADLRQGRCYLPESSLKPAGFAPADLLNPNHMDRFRPLYSRYLDLAAGHLEAGWNYTNSLPFGCVRVRVACAWPVLIGLQTIRRLRSGNALDAAQRIKISRTDVRKIMTSTMLYYPFPSAWRRLAEK
jgi:farnesyl-diphosphate farnesyltransferase